MAACGSLQHIFEKTLPENPTLFQSLSSWKNQMNPLLEPSSFTEVFGELYFKDINVSSHVSPSPPFLSSSSLSSSSLSVELNSQPTTNDKYGDEKERSLFERKKKGESFSRMNYESLQLCTEGLGFESTDDVDVDFMEKGMQFPLINKEKNQEENEEEKSRQSTTTVNRNDKVLREDGELKRSRLSWGGGERKFPPPISCIGKSGKPWVCFKPYREEGRFVLTEVRIPTLEFLHACREDGRFKLKFVQPEDEEQDKEDDYIEEEEEEEEDDYEEEETESCLEEAEQEKKEEEE